MSVPGRKTRLFVSDSGTLRCRDCGQEKPTNEFDKTTKNTCGHISRCKPCRKNYYRARPEKRLLTTAKSRAKKNGLDFDIELADVVIPVDCPLLGIPIVQGTGRVHESSPTLDRIDPTKGYVKGNVWVISHRANTIKNDSTLEELLRIVRHLESVLT